jgi:RimJ/RimL family protein N-acetyltransferase
MIIREIKIEDAENLISLIKQVEAESKFMLMEAGERTTSPEQQRKHIERIGRQTNSTILVAEKEGKLVGYLYVIGGSAEKTKHSAYIVIGILETYRGLGIGTNLFQHLEEWALNHHISRLELTVVTQNEAGVALYKKSGFEIEGTKRNSLLIDGKYVDEYYMAKLI